MFGLQLRCWLEMALLWVIWLQRKHTGGDIISQLCNNYTDLFTDCIYKWDILGWTNTVLNVCIKRRNKYLAWQINCCIKQKSSPLGSNCTEAKKAQVKSIDAASIIWNPYSLWKLKRMVQLLYPLTVADGNNADAIASWLVPPKFAVKWHQIVH